VESVRVLIVDAVDNRKVFDVGKQTVKEVATTESHDDRRSPSGLRGQMWVSDGGLISKAKSQASLRQ
jgi:hypothetical protein